MTAHSHMRGESRVKRGEYTYSMTLKLMHPQEVMITAHLISGLKLCPTLRMLYMTCGYTSPDASLDALPGVVEVTLCPTGASDMEVMSLSVMLSLTIHVL